MPEINLSMTPCVLKSSEDEAAFKNCRANSCTLVWRVPMIFSLRGSNPLVDQTPRRGRLCNIQGFSKIAGETENHYQTSVQHQMQGSKRNAFKHSRYFLFDFKRNQTGGHHPACVCVLVLGSSFSIRARIANRTVSDVNPELKPSATVVARDPGSTR